MSACSSPQQQGDENVNPFFNAEVIRWGAGDVLLSPVDIPDEEIDDQFAVLDEFAIPTATFEEHGITELKSGDMVRVVCSGLSENDDPESVSLFQCTDWTQMAISLMNSWLSKRAGLLRGGPVLFEQICYDCV